MTEEHPGRLLAASLHEALADELPQRLEFYEHWLHSEGLRGGRIGRAPLSAVLGFLRAEQGPAYERVVARAGALAAEWAVAAVPASRRRVIGWLPRSMRLRAALRVAATVARAVHPRTRCVGRVRQSLVEVHLSGSVFCTARLPQAAPLCGFYAALIVRTLEQFGLAAVPRIERCRAVEGTACVLLLTLEGTKPAISPAAAA
jgi:hypothetical protein